MADIKTVGVVGAGQMGNGIAQVAAMNGFPVVMTDISDAALEKGKATISKSLDRLLKKEKITFFLSFTHFSALFFLFSHISLISFT